MQNHKHSTPQVTAPIRIGIVGINGRMGKMLIQAIVQQDASTARCVLSAAIGRETSPYIGQDAGSFAGFDPLNVSIVTDLKQVVDQCDVIIDFTTDAALARHIQICVDARKALIIGITGLSEQLMQMIQSASKIIPIVHSGNYSIGVNLTIELVELATKILGQQFDVEILEAHHRHKIDAPSGTALMFAEAIEKARNRILEQDQVHLRYGNTGERTSSSIGLQAIRGGDIVGEHQVSFFGDGEVLSIAHIAYNRMNFATGAMQAAIWITQQTNGLYDMKNVLSI